MGPFRGIQVTNPWHWPYLVSVLATPIIFLICLVTVAIGGWLVFLVWFVFVMIVQPEEVERAIRQARLVREARRQLRRTSQVPRPR